MPTIAVQVPAPVADALSRQARSMLLGRRDYVRALLAAVASQESIELAGEPVTSGPLRTRPQLVGACE
jgi:hypothetical protein